MSCAPVPRIDSWAARQWPDRYGAFAVWLCAQGSNAACQLLHGSSASANACTFVFCTLEVQYCRGAGWQLAGLVAVQSVVAVHPAAGMDRTILMLPSACALTSIKSVPWPLHGAVACAICDLAPVNPLQTALLLLCCHMQPDVGTPFCDLPAVRHKGAVVEMTVQSSSADQVRDGLPATSGMDQLSLHSLARQTQGPPIDKQLLHTTPSPASRCRYHYPYCCCCSPRCAAVSSRGHSCLCPPTHTAF